jgi:hypothetical protein
LHVASSESSDNSSSQDLGSTMSASSLNSVSEHSWCQSSSVSANGSLFVSFSPDSANISSSEEVSYDSGSSPPSNPLASSVYPSSHSVSSASLTLSHESPDDLSSADSNWSSWSQNWSSSSKTSALVAVGAVSVGLSQLLTVESTSVSASSSGQSTLSPDRADLWTSNKVSDDSSSGPSTNPSALSVDLSALPVHYTSAVTLVDMSKDFSVDWMTFPFCKSISFYLWWESYPSLSIGLNHILIFVESFSASKLGAS